MGRALGHRGHRQRWAGPLLVGTAGFVVVLTTLLPLGELAFELVRAGMPGLHVLASSRPWWLLLRSLLLALTVTACTLVLGVPLGALFARARVPLRRILFGAHALPMLMPPFLSALGWFHLLGQRGMLGSEASSSVLFSVVGLVTILALTFTPVVTSLTALGVLAVDPSLEEAARLVARPLRVVTRILLPAAMPAVLLAALVVFALALSELGVPMFLRQEVYPATVFARLGGIDYAPGEAAALVLPLVPLALALLMVERRILGRRAFTVLGLRDRERTPLELGRLGAVAALVCILAASLSLLPVAALAIRAARGGGFTSVWSWMGSAPVNSLLIAGCAATVITAVGVVLGHALARETRGARLAAGVDGVALLGFFLPSAVLGVGLIAVWNRPSMLFLYGSIAVLVLGFVARYAVIGMRVFAAAVAQSSPSYEDAARIGGAGYARRLLRIVLPMHRRGVVAAWLVALVFCLRDLETAVLFYPPGGEPLTVRIFTLEANGPEAVVAALAVLHVGFTLLALLTGSSLLRVGGRA
jgi:iron(III) transport system permease protein